MKPFYITGFFLFFQYILKWFKMHSRMVKYAVQHNPDSVTVTRIHKFSECLFGSKLGIYLKVICGCILMIKVCLKYRIQVDALYSQFLQIRNLLNDSLQVSTHMMFSVRQSSPWFTSFRIISTIAITKSLRKYLIIDHSFCPLRESNDIRPIDIQIFKETRLGNYLLQSICRIIHHISTTVRQFKIIFLITRNLMKYYFPLKIIKQPISVAAFQFLFLLVLRFCSVPVNQNTFRYILFCTANLKY